ncbi:MAG: DNA-binding protein [Methanobacteriota archaeon]|nr:MAG: DNA-binding protein [Euryarchaeota archaeon]
MEFKGNGSIFFLRLDPDEKIMETLLAFLEDQFIPSGTLMAVGAVKEATLRYFNQKEKTFVEKVFAEPMEVTSLTGNITVKDGTPYVHPHVVLGRRDFSTISGHLQEGVVGPTLEITIQAFDLSIQRIHSEEIGLNILHFD